MEGGGTIYLKIGTDPSNPNIYAEHTKFIHINDPDLDGIINGVGKYTGLNDATDYYLHKTSVNQPTITQQAP